MATTSTAAVPSPTSPSQEEEAKKIILAEEGDVIILLLDKAEIRVSSAILSQASPVFKKMLGPHFLEGQAPRSSAQPKEIKLHDDEPKALEMLLKLVHFYDIEDVAVTPPGLLGLAVLADKYDCAKSLTLMTEALLKRCVDGGEPLQSARVPFWARLATAAYLLRSSKSFTKYTRHLIVNCTVSCLSIMDLEDCRSLPSSLICKREQFSNTCLLVTC
ncbi:hypothetical protein LTR17_024598 [Elasticomyces elasticus]|nr:hypothetical protein LTR17_024598 [Elasticomyces elasticus]